MNTFGSDLNKILSARERAHADGRVSADVPVIKADTIKKEELEKEEPEKEEPEKEEPEKEEPEKEELEKESEV